MEYANYRHMQGMTAQQQALFLGEMISKKKNKGTAAALVVILGPWALALYMGKAGLGILYLVLQVVALLSFVLIVPPLVWLGWYIWAICTVGSTVDAYNEQVAADAVAMVGLLTPAAN
jgi:hypothetical protein